MASKILTTLRSTGSPAQQTPPTEPAPTLAPQDIAPEPVGGDDVSFIEIGPKRKVVDASPDVLAIAVPARAPAPKRGVTFRGLNEPKKSRLAPELIAFHTPDDPAAAQYTKLLTSLIDAGRRRPGTCQVLLFTGTRPEVGCTTALLNVAVSAARGGFKVAVLDANLRRPGIASRLALEDAPGLAEVLSGEAEAQDSLRETEQENLMALTAGSAVPVLADLGEMEPLIDQMREAFDLVLIDGPRWDGRAVCMALSQLADAVFLVAPSSEADEPPASDLMRDLPARGVRLAGCVLTNV